jgi:hypothetical protein
MKKKQVKEYSDDLDILIALISYLALSQYKSMRPSKLAERLALELDLVIKVLDRYKGIFRKSFKTHNETREHYYTLHMRYALRFEEGARNEEQEEGPKLSSDQVNILLRFVIDKAAQENALKNERKKNLITMTAAIIAAIAAITGAILNFIK